MKLKPFLTLLLSTSTFAADYPYQISCLAPTERTDGSPLTNLDRYKIQYKECSSGPTTTTIIPATTCSAIITLPKKNYCWNMIAVDANNLESAPSNTAVMHLNTDTDGDTIPDYNDNCTLKFNLNQVDSDADGFGNHCDGDMNGDQIVNSFDTPLFRAQIAKPSIPPIYNPADLNTNGYVNAFDTAIFRSLLGKAPGPKAP
jgi:Thrombospondin type 3 repeat